jgi:hypothetical protein
MKYLVLVFLFVCVVNAKIYRQHNIEVVVDTNNSLMWVDNITNIKILRIHEDAISYCKNLTHAGYSNWRIPKLKEFEYIVEKRNPKTYINYAFKYNLPTGYWAKRAHWRTLWFYADYMHFVSGTKYFDSRHKKKYVRCVRDN